jgi:hypothetical protein
VQKGDIDMKQRIQKERGLPGAGPIGPGALVVVVMVVLIFGCFTALAQMDAMNDVPDGGTPSAEGLESMPSDLYPEQGNDGAGQNIEEPEDGLYHGEEILGEESYHEENVYDGEQPPSEEMYPQESERPVEEEIYDSENETYDEGYDTEAESGVEDETIGAEFEDIDPNELEDPIEDDGLETEFEEIDPGELESAPEE